MALLCFNNILQKPVLTFVPTNAREHRVYCYEFHFAFISQSVLLEPMTFAHTQKLRPHEGVLSQLRLSGYILSHSFSVLPQNPCDRWIYLKQVPR